MGFMKHKTATFISLGATMLVLAPIALATSSVRTSVNVSTNTGNNTVCVNGNCTTSNGSTGKSTVCINGKCTTSEGEIHMEEQGAKVEIKNGSSNVSIEQKASAESTNRVEVKQDVKGSATSQEELDKAKKEIEDAKKKVDEAEKENFDLVVFIKEQMESIRRIITLQFLFGDK
jgi:hypothetical protein